MYGFIYVTTNTINKMKYIGKCVYGRVNNWDTYLGSGVYLKRSIKKYGKDNFIREIIEEADNEETLRALEEYYIDKFNAVDDPMYYNIKKTSIGGDTFTHNPRKDSIRNLKSINARGKRNPQYDKEKTDKFKRVIKDVNSRPILINGVEYVSITEASERLNIGVTTISYRLDSNSDMFKGYIRLCPKNKVKAGTKTNKPKPVKIYGVEYKSIADASRTLGFSSAKIVKRIKFDSDFEYI